MSEYNDGMFVMRVACTLRFMTLSLYCDDQIYEKDNDNVST